MSMPSDVSMRRDSENPQPSAQSDSVCSAILDIFQYKECSGHIFKGLTGHADEVVSTISLQGADWGLGARRGLSVNKN